MTRSARQSATAWPRRLKLRHLEVLLEIAGQGSLTGAARTLHMSQPAVSQWLSDLEAAVGVPLFERGRRLRPTPFAAPLLRHARRILADLGSAQDELQAIERGNAGRVRLGALLVGSGELIPRVVTRLRRDGAAIELELVEDILAGLWARMDRHELDLLVVRLDRRALDSGLPFEVLFEDVYSVFMRRGHPLARLLRASWKDAQRYPWVLPPRGTPLRQTIESTFLAARLPMPEAWAESASVAMTQAILRESDCLAVFSTGTGRYYDALGVLRLSGLQLQTGAGPFGIVRRDPEPDAALRRVIEALRDEAAQLEVRRSARAAPARRPRAA